MRKYILIIAFFSALPSLKAQLVHKIAEMKDFYILDTITIEDPYRVRFLDSCGSDKCANAIILDKSCLDSVIKNNWTYNETYKYCGYPIISWYEFNIQIFKYFYLEKKKYINSWELFNPSKLYHADTNYKNLYVFKVDKYCSSIKKFYLCLISVKEYNGLIRPSKIPIQANGYLLVVFPLLTDKIKQEIKYTDEELKQNK